MSAIRPAIFSWREVELVDGDGVATKARAMVPTPRFRPMAERQFEDGEEYALGVVEHRSTKSHNHLFAAIAATWENLPYELAQRWPSEEHLRKWALVQAGHCTDTHSIFDTAKDAKRHAIELRKYDAYAVIAVSGNVVNVRVAKSISRQAVRTKEQFQKIKNRVFDVLAEQTGLDKTALGEEARSRARPAAKQARFAS